MAKISGTTSENGRIYVINQNGHFVEHSQDVVAGSYIIRNLSEGDKTVVFKRDDGETRSFGDVSSIYEPGAIFTFGNNQYGQLGLDDTQNRSTPTQVGSYTEWKISSFTNYHILLIRNDGTLWVCGYNNYGQLGLNDQYIHRSAFVQVGSDTNWKNSSNSLYSSFAVKTDGTLWSCGANAAGELGLNDRTNRSTFTQVGSDTDWDSVFGGYQNYVLAKKNDGTIWSCGVNAAGELGQDDRISRSTFTQIGSDTDWRGVFPGNTHVTAIKNDGTLWCWGQGSGGRLGTNSTTSRSTPTKVGDDTNWRTAITGSGFVFALKSDSTLWSWGINNYGVLGHGDSVSRSTPAQVGSDTDWRSVGCGQSHSLAIKDGGTLWSCGYNNKGQLGLNDTVYRSTFTQVGSDTGWESVFGGYDHTIGKK